MTQEQKDARLDTLLMAVPQMVANEQQHKLNHDTILKAMAEGNPTAYTQALVAAGHSYDEASNRLGKLQRIIAYIDATPAEQLTEDSIRAVE